LALNFETEVKMKIAFIQTGGTIDKDYPHSIKGWAFEIGSPAFKSILDNAQQRHEVSVYEVCRKDSLDINSEDRNQIRSLCQSLNEKAIIITHGSDTLLKTAAALNYLQNKTIILTGSMLPEKFKDSDAPFNLGMAVAGVQVLEPGIYIAIHGLLAPWNDFSRDMKTGKYHLKIKG